MVETNHSKYQEAFDAFAPALDPAQWREASRESHTAASGLPFSFVRYVRRSG